MKIKVIIFFFCFFEINLHAGRFCGGEVFRTTATIEKSIKGHTSSKRKRTCLKTNDY